MTTGALSIRAFATVIGVGHNTLSGWIREIEEQKQISIGAKGGQGKATKLSTEDQALILQAKGITITQKPEIPPVNQEDATPEAGISTPGKGGGLVRYERGGALITRPLGGSTDSSSYTLEAEPLDLKVYQPEKLSITVRNTSKATAAKQQEIEGMTSDFLGNEDLIEQALLDEAVQRGEQLGVRLAAAELGAAFEKKERAKVHLLRQKGLIEAQSQQTMQQPQVETVEVELWPSPESEVPPAAINDFSFMLPG